jgi:toxin ParE1/3/4
MRWKVVYTDDALLDLQSIYDYIALILLSPENAINQTERIMDATDLLDQMPFRHRLYNKEPWRSKGLRLLPIDNYIVFYIPDETKGIVLIIRVMYGGRDIDRQLGCYFNS